MKTYEEEILDCIDDIDKITMESELSVLSSMIDAYDKSIMILENYEGDDVSCFDIFQEGFKDDVKEAFKGKDGEHILKKILMAIPRLFMAIGKIIRAAWNNRKSKRLQQELNALRKQVETLTNNVDELSKNQKAEEEAQGLVNQALNDSINMIMRDKQISDAFMHNLQSQINNNEAISEKTIASIRREISNIHKSINDKSISDKVDIISKQLNEHNTLIDAINGLLLVRIDYEEIYELYETIYKLLGEVGEYLIQGDTFKYRYDKPFESETLKKLNEYMENGLFTTGERSVENFVYDFEKAAQLLDKSDKLASKIDDMCGKIAKHFIEDSHDINSELEKNDDSVDWVSKNRNLRKIWDDLKRFLSYMKKVSDNVEQSRRDVYISTRIVQSYWNKIHRTTTEVPGRLFD